MVTHQGCPQTPQTCQRPRPLVLVFGGSGFKRRFGVFQKGQLFGGAGAVEDRVSVGETAKAFDDSQVTLGIGHQIGPTNTVAHQEQGQPLSLQAFGMFERQINEEAAISPEAQIMGIVDHVVSQGQRHGVGGERVCRVTEDVARGLIEQQQKRQAAGRRLSPGLESTGHSLPVSVQPRLPDLLVEPLIRCKPKRPGGGREPEVENGKRALHTRCAVLKSQALEHLPLCDRRRFRP